MAETKRVNDQYKISAPTIIIDGNLTVTGSTTSVETVNSNITDNIIVLNNGESGAGVTAGSAGIEIDRGSSDSASLKYIEADDVFEFKIGSSYSIVRGDTPVDNNDLVTKNFLDIAIQTISPGGSIGSVQYNNGASFAGDSNLMWDSTTLTLANLRMADSTISVATTDDNLTLTANGAGKVYFLSALRIENSLSDPTADADSNTIFVKDIGNAGSGVYFVNNSASDELVSKSKAILFGLIF